MMYLCYYNDRATHCLCAAEKRLLPHDRSKKEPAARTKTVGHGYLNGNVTNCLVATKLDVLSFLPYKADERPAWPFKQKAKGNT
jgi:hypothetical protein